MDNWLKAEQLEGLVVTEENIIIGMTGNSYQDVIRTLAEKLHDGGFVKDSYVQAVLDREEVFPTGLQVEEAGVAIPHSDAEHVITSTLGIATLKQPVEFRAMAEPDKIIPVSLVMMLAVAEPKKVVLVLRKVINILKNGAAIKALNVAKTALDAKRILLDHIRSETEKVK
ncbi:MAG: PTS sugar transporter subunit IIA [Chloroflexota bacterium]|jgi:PTS system galactitol-specific IIA component|nr:PTS sugar transporter subunit IIA [Chloroflexota bacterium]